MRDDLRLKRLKTKETTEFIEASDRRETRIEIRLSSSKFARVETVNFLAGVISPQQRQIISDLETIVEFLFQTDDRSV